MNNWIKALIIIIIPLGGQAQLLDSLSLETLPGMIELSRIKQSPDSAIKIVLRKQKLTEFPKEILNCKNLQYLDLSK